MPSLLRLPLADEEQENRVAPSLNTTQTRPVVILFLSSLQHSFSDIYVEVQAFPQSAKSK